MRTLRMGACAVLAAAALAVTAGPAVATNDLTIEGKCRNTILEYEVTLIGVGNTPGSTQHPETEEPISFTVSSKEPEFMAFSELWTRHSNGASFVSGDKTETIIGTTATSSCRSSSTPTVTRDPTYAKSVAVGNAVRAANRDQPGASGYTSVANAWNAYCAALEDCTDTLPTSPAAYCTELGITGTGFKLTGGYVC